MFWLNFMSNTLPVALAKLLESISTIIQFENFRPIWPLWCCWFPLTGRGPAHDLPRLPLPWAGPRPVGVQHCHLRRMPCFSTALWFDTISATFTSLSWPIDKSFNMFISARKDRQVENQSMQRGENECGVGGCRPCGACSEQLGPFSRQNC